MKTNRWFALVLLFALRLDAAGGVIINEIFYQAPQDIARLQWIELHNTSATPADLSGWQLGNGVEFQFPPGSSISPRGFTVVCQDKQVFSEFYGATPIGEFKKSLKRRGESIDLIDATGRRVDRVKFSNEAPWPVAADGYSSSLERITPDADGSRPSNWAASPLAHDESQPAGSPGQANFAHSEVLPPVIANVTITPSQPRSTEKITFHATVEDPAGVRVVELRYQRVEPGKVSEETVVPMRVSADRTFTAEIPPQAPGTFLRFAVRAVNAKQAERFHPSRTDLRPALSIYVPAEAVSGRIPLAYVINTDPRDVAGAVRYRTRARRGAEDPFGNPKWRGAQQTLLAGLDLGSTWLELTVNRSIDHPSYRRLRSVIALRSAERDRQLEEFVGSTDLDAAIAEAPAKIARFQAALKKEILEALPANQRDAFEQWYAAETKPKERDPGQFLKSLVKIEGGWLALNNRFELTEPQLSAARAALKKGLEGRAAQVPILQKVMRGQADFGDLQNALGKVESQMTTELLAGLTLRQARAYQQWQRDHGGFLRPRLTDRTALAPRGGSAFIVVDPATGKTEVFDFVNMTERSAGYKVRLHKDRPFRGMSTVNVIFEYNDRFVLAEPLAFDLYRRVGAPASQTDFVRLHLDGQAIGYHLVFEQVNRSFLRRHRVDPDGDLYKLIWYGRGLEGQHERQNDPEGGHAALQNVVAQLDATKGDEQWAVIQKHFNVDEVINYFAVNMCLSHWDGFFNNYFAYHDRKGSGKWEMYPWDQDKTWGFHDSIPAGEIFVNMPITFGMEGDRPPGGGEPRFNPGSWWRPGGYFSKPLLANPEFRGRFLRRTREILETHYTPAVMFPVIDQLGERLRPEIPLRATAIGEEPSEALKRFETNLASLKQHLVKRREFLLEEREIKALASPR